MMSKNEKWETAFKEMKTRQWEFTMILKELTHSQ